MTRIATRVVHSTKSRLIVSVLLCGFPCLRLDRQPRKPRYARISLEEAQRRAVAASHRLAEARARAATADAVIAVREAADRPFVALGAGTREPITSLEFLVPSPAGFPSVLYPDVPATTAPGSTCNGRSTAAAGRTRWSAPRGRRPRRRQPMSPPRRPISGWKSRARSGRW